MPYLYTGATVRRRAVAPDPACGSRYRASSAQSGRSTDVSAFSATFAVDSEGVIHSASYDITYTTKGEEQTVTMEFELSDLGETSVERPDWADEAR